MSTTLERIAAWSSSLELDDIPERVRARAKLQILSIMAAICAGFPTRAARAIREVILSTRAHGRATVFPQGERTSPTVAVVANAAASMAQDFDDFLFLGHTGHAAVLASLALAEERGLGGRELLCAQVAANEVAGRFGASVVLGPQNGQLWTHIHAPAAACAGARLLELDAQATAHAMAISLYQPPFAMWPGFMGPDSKLLSASMPARDGLFAARLASWGLTGPLDVLDAGTGFGAHFAHCFLPAMFSGFGKAWVSDTLSYKIHPGCAYVHSALDALFTVMAEYESTHGRRLEPADVVEATVRTHLLATEMDRLGSSRPGDPLTPVRVNFSLKNSLALALAAGRLTPAELGEEELEARRETVEATAGKIRVEHDWAMTLALFERVTEHLPLNALLRAVDMQRLLSLGGEVGRQLGGVLDLKPRDILKIGGFLLARAPGLVLQASRAAASGLGGLAGKSSEQQDRAGFDLSEADFEKMPMPFVAEVTLRLRGDQEMTARVDIPRGTAGSDPAETTGLVRKKFRDQATPLLTGEKVERALALVDHLEDLDDLGELTAALTTGS